MSCQRFILGLVIGFSLAVPASAGIIFNRTKPAPQRVPELIESARFEILQDRLVKQTFYPSRVLVARK